VNKVSERERKKNIEKERKKRDGRMSGRSRKVERVTDRKKR
jgi:hypothetical protein